MWDIATGAWNYPLITLSTGGTITVKQIILVTLLLIAGWITSRWLERAVGRRLEAAQLHADAAYALQRLLFYTVLIVVVVTALSLLHVPLTAFAFISGAVAIGVGFGAQNIINNLISGWILMSERPVRIGDFVEIADSYGTIERIGNRSTRIRRTDGVHMLVPNSHILENIVVNWTLVDQLIRTTVRVGVAYGSPVRKVESLIYQAVGTYADILGEPKPVVVFEDFGDNALIFDVYFWCEVSGERELRLIRSELRFRICDLFAEHGIVVAFPQRDVHLDSAEPLQIRVVRAATDQSAG